MTFSELLDKARGLLFGRQRAYKAAFGGAGGKDVLTDLARFCYAHRSTFHPDARAHAVAEGRREVWLRIASHLNLTPEELWDLYDGRRDVSEG